MCLQLGPSRPRLPNLNSAIRSCSDNAMNAKRWRRADLNLSVTSGSIGENSQCGRHCGFVARQAGGVFMEADRRPVQSGISMSIRAGHLVPGALPSPNDVSTSMHARGHAVMLPVIVAAHGGGRVSFASAHGSARAAQIDRRANVGASHDPLPFDPDLLAAIQQFHFSDATDVTQSLPEPAR